MLVVAKQDDVDNLFAVWNTVTDRFLGVNIPYDECIKMVMEYKECSYEKAKDRVDNPQPFDDIARYIRRGFEPDKDEILSKFEELKHWLDYEMERAKFRIKEPSSMYDGVKVGFDISPQLQERHIKFCGQILKILELESEVN